MPPDWQQRTDGGSGMCECHAHGDNYYRGFFDCVCRMTRSISVCACLNVSVIATGGRIGATRVFGRNSIALVDSYTLGCALMLHYRDGHVGALPPPHRTSRNARKSVCADSTGLQRVGPGDRRREYFYYFAVVWPYTSHGRPSCGYGGDSLVTSTLFHSWESSGSGATW